jgi:hypothetical protein
MKNNTSLHNEETAVKWLKIQIINQTKIMGLELNIDGFFEEAFKIEAKQRQEDTNHGYSEGYDDGAQGKEPMRPGVLELGASFEEITLDKNGKPIII